MHRKCGGLTERNTNDYMLHDLICTILDLKTNQLNKSRKKEMETDLLQIERGSALSDECNHYGPQHKNVHQRLYVDDSMGKLHRSTRKRWGLGKIHCNLIVTNSSWVQMPGTITMCA